MTIEEDEDGVISGSFEFTGYRRGKIDHPDYYTMQNGQFRVEEQKL